MARKRATPLITDFDNIPADALVPEDEQPYEIPAHWKWVRLGALFAPVRGVTYKKSDVVSGEEGSVLVLRGGNVCEGSLELDRADSVYVPSSLVSSQQMIQKNDVVIVSSTGSPTVIGRAGLAIRDETHIAFGAFLTVARATAAVDAEYLDVLFQSDLYRPRIRSLAQGVNINNIKNAHYWAIAVPLPPIDEQNAIVGKLQATNQKIDDVLERLDQFLDQAPQQRAAIIQAGVSGNLTKAWREEHGGTMGTWMNTTVQGLGQVVTGGTPPTKDPANYGPGIAFVKPADLNQGRHVVGAEATLSAIGAERSRVLPPNSVAMCCIGATITKTGLIEVESATNQQINAVVPNDGTDPVFIYYLFESTRFKQQVLDNSSATTLPIINKGRFSKLPVLVPPKKEQAEIATKVDAALASAGRAVEAATVVKTQLELTKSVVRMRALRGLV